MKNPTYYEDNYNKEILKLDCAFGTKENMKIFFLSKTNTKAVVSFLSYAASKDETVDICLNLEDLIRLHKTLGDILTDIEVEGNS